MTTTNLTATATTSKRDAAGHPEIGQIVLEDDGDVLIGLRLPNAVGLGRRDEESPILKEATTQLEVSPTSAPSSTCAWSSTAPRSSARCGASCRADIPYTARRSATASWPAASGGPGGRGR